MKIAFIITSTGWGGLEMNVLKLATLLSEKGYSISLITQEKSTIFNKRKDLFFSTILLNNRRKYFNFISAKIISKSLKNEGIRTLMVFDNKDIDVVAWTKRLFYNNLNVIYQQQMQIGINKKDLIHTFRFNSINYWISPLQYLKNEISDRTKFPIERVKVIPLCVDIKKFTHRKYSKQEALQILNIIPQAPLIGIIGRISKKKGQLFLVESLIKLKQMGIDIELLIFGSATINDPECQNYYNDLLKKIKQNKLEDVVHIVKFQEDVSVFYNAVDVFALASHSETFGMVTVEAMLSKLPIIATQSGGTSEILDYGKLGLLYEYENYDDFCKKLIWLISNKIESENMAILAQRTACDKYCQEIEINGIDCLLKKFSTEENRQN